MVQSPLVSVVIPFYDHLDWMIEAVNSVLNQTYKNIEVIVINDGSTENMEDFITTFSNKIIYIHKDNGGPATARNLGIEMAKGDYIAFLDSDDKWLPTKLEKQIAIMERTNCIWSHTAYETFDTEQDEPNTLKKISVANFSGMIYPKMLMSNNLATPCIIIRGAFLRNNSNLRFNNKMRYGQDQYLWLNIATKYEIIAIDEVLTRVRMRGSNAAIRAKVQLQARAIIWQILNQDKKKFRVKEIPGLTKAAYELSSMGNKNLAKLEKIIRNTMGLEMASRIMYVIPWMMFRIDYRRTTGH